MTTQRPGPALAALQPSPLQHTALPSFAATFAPVSTVFGRDTLHFSASSEKKDDDEVGRKWASFAIHTTLAVATAASFVIFPPLAILAPYFLWGAAVTVAKPGSNGWNPLHMFKNGEEIKEAERVRRKEKADAESAKES